MSGKYYKHFVIRLSSFVLLMAKLCCVDYGFECAFAAESDDASKMIDDFAKHTSDQHGIEYSKEVLMQFMLRKGDSTSELTNMQTA